MGDLDEILAALEPSLGPVVGGPTPLEGGITNRNYRVRFGREEYVVRLHGKDTDLLGISREAERLAGEAAAAIGLAPAVAAQFDGGLVTRFLACDGLDSAQIASAAVEIAVALRRFHDCAVRLPVAFGVPRLLSEYERVLRARGGEPSGAYEEVLRIVERIDDALPPAPARPCHNDLLAGNLVRCREDGRVMIVDWEYAGMGDPYFDLGNLSVNNAFDEADDARLLTAYHGGAPTDAQRARLALARVLSDAREAAWGVVQRQLSELDFDFDGYAAEHFERLRAAVAGTGFERALRTAGEG